MTDAEDHEAAGHVYTMLHYDGKTPDQVAKILGINPTRLPGLIRLGAEHYGKDPDEAVQRLLRGPGSDDHPHAG